MEKTELTRFLAYEKTIESLGNKQMEVLRALKEIEPANNRMIAEFMNLPINQITPRIHELRQDGLVKPEDTIVDSKTRRLTVFWRTNLL